MGNAERWRRCGEPVSSMLRIGVGFTASRAIQEEGSNERA